MRTHLLALSLALLVSPQQAEARSNAELPYPPAQVWTAAVQMRRADLGFEVLERDEDAGYVLFTYKDLAQTSPGAMELVKLAGDSRPTKVVFQLRDMPRYHEIALLDRLARKLHDDYGDPPRPRPPAKAPPPAKRPDAGPRP